MHSNIKATDKTSWPCPPFPSLRPFSPATRSSIKNSVSIKGAAHTPQICRLMDLHFDLNSVFDDTEVEQLDDFSWSEMSQVLSTQDNDSPPLVSAIGSENAIHSLYHETPTTPILSNIPASTVTASSEQPPSKNDGLDGKVIDKRKKKQASKQARRKKLASSSTTFQKGPWTLDDFRILADSILKLHHFLEEAKKRKQIVSREERWVKVSTWCKEGGVNRLPFQCQDKWENHFPKFKKIRDWDKRVPSGMSSWVQMDPDKHVSKGFPKHFDEGMYNILEERFSTDILVELGPILVDSAEATYEQLNVRGGTSQPCVDGVQTNSTGNVAPCEGGGQQA